MLTKRASIISIIGGSSLQSEDFQHPLRPARIDAQAQMGLKGLFSKTSVLMMHFLGGAGTPKITQKSLRAAVFCFRNACKFGLGFGAGSAKAPLKKRRSNDAGSAALTSTPCRSQNHNLQQQHQGVARIRGCRGWHFFA